MSDSMACPKCFSRMVKGSRYYLCIGCGETTPLPVLEEPKKLGSSGDEKKGGREWLKLNYCKE